MTIKYIDIKFLAGLNIPERFKNPYYKATMNKRTQIVHITIIL